MVFIKNYNIYYKLRTLPFVKEIWLFGSRAKQKEQERSDIDLAIVCPQASSEDWQKVLSIIHEADTLLKIDCIRFDTLTDQRLKKEIEDTKVILFQRVETHHPWYETFLDLKEALDKFADILQYKPQTFPYVVEATLQIFEYAFELYWKLLKKICQEEGLEANSPRSVFQQAYAAKLIDDERVWLEMIEDRNLTSHTYRQPVADEIYGHCEKYSKVMINTYEKLQTRFGLR